MSQMNLREYFPYWVRITGKNVYDLPIGTVFRYARRSRESREPRFPIKVCLGEGRPPDSFDVYYHLTDREAELFFPVPWSSSLRERVTYDHSRH